MRIVGGELRGRRLAGPVDDGGRARLRPTSDRMREAIFNILAHGSYPPLEGARVLDLFAGTGALGIEALSRGAARAVFVDQGREARELLKRNIEGLGLSDRARVIGGDATRYRPGPQERFDIIFCDAPYNRALTRPALDSLLAAEAIAPDAAFVVETGAEEAFDPPSALICAAERRYGAGKIHILTPDEP